MAKGIIFDIKRYAIHDGPGIRTTVFLKGCTLRCEWCQNPEGQESDPEIMVRSFRCAEECFECVSACPQSAISKNGQSIQIDLEKCDLCGDCEDACSYEAIEMIGREVTVHDVMDEIKKDKVFFEESKGGVTISGGEPLMQTDFLEELLEEIKKSNIHAALDTSGNISFEDLDRISQKVDLFLYDLKIINNGRHERFTGVSNELILENLRKLTEKKRDVIVRIPLIEGFNDDDESIRLFVDYFRSLKNIKQISLLPYHRGGCEKYKRLRKENSQNNFRPPSDERIEAMRRSLADSGFSVKIGG